MDSGFVYTIELGTIALPVSIVERGAVKVRTGRSPAATASQSWRYSAKIGTTSGRSGPVVAAKAAVFVQW